MEQSAKTRGAERSLYYVLMAGIILGFTLRFVGLGVHSLWVDELLTLKNAHIGEPGILSWVKQNLQGPAISLMMHYWAGLGTTEVVLRLPFAVAGALTIPATYLLVRELAGRWTGLSTAFLLALSPIHIWYSQEIRGYAFVMLFSVLATYFFVEWRKEGSPRSLALYALMVFGGLLCNLSMAFLALVHFLYLLLRRRRPREIAWWLAAMCVVLIAFSPWLQEIMARVHPERVVTGEVETSLISGSELSAMAIPYSVYVFGVGYTLGPSKRDLQVEREASLRRDAPYILLGTVAAGIPLLVGLVGAARSDRNLLTLVLLWLAVPALVVTVLAARNIRVFNPRYLLVALPAYVLLLGTGAARMSRTRFAVLLLPLLIAVTLSIHNYYSDPHYAKDDFRAAAQAIRADYRPGDTVVGVYSSEPLEFYLSGLADVHVYSRDDMASRESMEARSRQLAEKGKRVWLSLCRTWQVDPNGYIHAWFEDNLDRLEYHSFAGVDIILYGRRGI